MGEQARCSGSIASGGPAGQIVAITSLSLLDSGRGRAAAAESTEVVVLDGATGARQANHHNCNAMSVDVVFQARASSSPTNSATCCSRVRACWTRAVSHAVAARGNEASGGPDDLPKQKRPPKQPLPWWRLGGSNPTAQAEIINLLASCNDHAGLSGAAVPVRPPWSRLFSTCVAATRQRGYTVPCTGKHYDRAHPIRSRRAVRAR